MRTRNKEMVNIMYSEVYFYSGLSPELNTAGISREGFNYFGDMLLFYATRQ